MNTYFISDLHFGHYNIIRFDNRPFKTVEEMDNTLIVNWNDTINDDDIVYILGDISWYNPEQTYNILKQLKGKKILIKGNHDNIVKDKRCREQFITIKDYDEIYLNNQLIILSHYPIMYWKNQWHGTIHLYGHIHVTRDYDHLLDYIQNEHKIGNPCKMYNVGCMMPRQKLINTYHCNKHEQRILDDYIKNNRINHSYYHLYNSDKTNFALMIGIGFNSACVALNKLGITIKNADNTYKSIGEVIQEASIKWKELT